MRYQPIRRRAKLLLEKLQQDVLNAADAAKHRGYALAAKTFSTGDLPGLIAPFLTADDLLAVCHASRILCQSFFAGAVVALTYKIGRRGPEQTIGKTCVDHTTNRICDACSCIIPDVHPIPLPPSSESKPVNGGRRNERHVDIRDWKDRQPGFGRTTSNLLSDLNRIRIAIASFAAVTIKTADTIYCATNDLAAKYSPFRFTSYHYYGSPTNQPIWPDDDNKNQRHIYVNVYPTPIGRIDLPARKPTADETGAALRLIAWLRKISNGPPVAGSDYLTAGSDGDLVMIGDATVKTKMEPMRPMHYRKLDLTDLLVVCRHPISVLRGSLNLIRCDIFTPAVVDTKTAVVDDKTAVILTDRSTPKRKVVRPFRPKQRPKPIVVRPMRRQPVQQIQQPRRNGGRRRG